MPRGEGFDSRPPPGKGRARDTTGLYFLLNLSHTILNIDQILLSDRRNPVQQSPHNFIFIACIVNPLFNVICTFIVCLIHIVFIVTPSPVRHVSAIQFSKIMWMAGKQVVRPWRDSNSLELPYPSADQYTLPNALHKGYLLVVWITSFFGFASKLFAKSSIMDAIDTRRLKAWRRNFSCEALRMERVV